MLAFTSSVHASHCIQAAPAISFIFKEVILKTILFLLEEGNHCFGAAQASIRTWEGAHVLHCPSALVWQWKRFYTGSLRLCSWHEQQNSPLKGQLQSSLSESLPLQGLFCRVSLPKADWRALFDHLALVTTFAWVLLCPLQSFSLTPCIRAVPHSGSQAFPSNALCISSYYQEI